MLPPSSPSWTTSKSNVRILSGPATLAWRQFGPFFRFVAFRDPEQVALAAQLLAIPIKRACRRLVGYLTREEMDALIAAPDRTCWGGRRDHALLVTLYNSGARVSEIAAIQRSQIAFNSTTSLVLHGKGRKERSVPLWAKTARILETWLKEIGHAPDGNEHSDSATIQIAARRSGFRSAADRAACASVRGGGGRS
jgi:site-specific recombinase XerD